MSRLDAGLKKVPNDIHNLKKYLNFTPGGKLKDER